MDVKQEQAEAEIKQSCDNCGSPITAWTKETTQISRAEAGEKAASDQQGSLHAHQQHGSEEHQLKYIGGRYRILELIGSGGVGSVYKVEHDLLNKIYAIKLVNPDAVADLKVKQRFHQEAQAVADLSHPNLIGVHDFGISEDGAPYLVMDYLDGISLDYEIERCGHIEEKRALAIFMQICAGLSYAHSKGIIHRDLTPSNVMLVKDDNGNEIPKIVDFGIAKRQAVDAKLTQTGDIFGTPLYMSPEQCLGNEVDARSDIYSLGCIMYETLSGTQPFDGINAIQIIFKHLNEEPKPLRKVCENFEVSPGIEQIVASCLQIEPERRPPSADGLALNLERVADGKPPLSTGVLPKVRRKHLTRAAQIGSISVVSIVLFVFAMAGLHTITEPDYQKLLAQAQQEFESGHEQQALSTGEAALAKALGHGKSVPASDMCSIYGWLSTCAERMGDYEKAAASADKATTSAEQSGDLSAQDAYALSAARYERAFDAGLAQHWYKRAVATRQRRVGANSPELIRVLLEAGRCAYKHRTNDTDLQNSIAYLEHAARIAETHLGSSIAISPTERFQLYEQLGISDSLLRRYAQADKALVKAQLLIKSAELEPEQIESIKKLHAEVRTHLRTGKSINSSDMPVTGGD